MTMQKQIQQLLKVAQGLTESQLACLLGTANTLNTNIQCKIMPSSDIVDEAFNNDFMNRLLMHHATTAAKMKKEAFEFAFINAANASGKKAQLAKNMTNPGFDVVVDSIPFSLKTEAEKNIKLDIIKISKLMESAGVRNFSTKGEYVRYTREHIVPLLRKAKRIIVLRCFNQSTYLQYHLVEIPLELLLKIEKFTDKDFSERTRVNSSWAGVYDSKGLQFKLNFDGSDEKITINGLRVDLCIIHGYWQLHLA